MQTVLKAKYLEEDIFFCFEIYMEGIGIINSREKREREKHYQSTLFYSAQRKFT
jgi:hypothetical protein